MKILKKLAALSAAASVAIGTLAVDSYAEEAYKIHVDAPAASVGETVSVKAIIDVGSTEVGAVSFFFNYDAEELELISAKLGDKFEKGWLSSYVDDNGSNALDLNVSGRIGFACITLASKGLLSENVVLLTASFKVLKPNAELTYGEVYVGANDEDGTEITNRGGFEGAIIKCSHKNTETNTTPATCKDSGKKETVCKDCGTAVKTETIPATGEHDWKEEVTKPATCTEKGSKTLTCKVCGETKAEEIPELGHNWDKGSITTEPTCTEKGVKTFTCTKCHETKTENVPANGHDWGEWKVTKEATTEAEGEETRECKICGEKETKAIAKLPSENITTSYSGGGFSVPETTASTAAPAESETVTSAAATQTDAVTQAPETTANVTAAVTADPATDNTSADIQDNIGIGNADSENSIGNTGVGNANDKNIPTGMALAVIPAAAAAAGVVIFKKRK